MALIKCPECGKDISDKATTCPNCGCPIFQKTDNITYETDNSDEDEEEMEESYISIASLVLFILGVLLLLLKIGGGALLELASFVLVIISHFQHDKKVVCATIVFWIFTVGFILTILLAILL